tara:strand:- start:3284 stop:3511 length:228 start_codon:yes stop_codon:yes gene_type:complete
MYYHIKLTGDYQASRKPWLALGMGGSYSFGNMGYAHKFFCLDSAKYILEDVNAKGKQAFITWHNGEQWGEVNLNA